MQEKPSPFAVEKEEVRTMLSATSYPVLNIFWTMLEFFLFFIWIWLAIMVFADIFRSHDIGGGTKALWVIFIVLIPYVGIFAYLLFRGGAMHERAASQAALQQKMFNQHFPHYGNGSTTADQLHKLADLKEKGFITDAEFQAEKSKILA
jgi:Phospholipase_D-nuclease N-terminal/Short C-terminal domain